MKFIARPRMPKAGRLLSLVLVSGAAAFSAPSLVAGQLAQSTGLSLDKHVYDQSTSFCAGNDILLYNSLTGEAMAGNVNADALLVTRNYNPGEFLPRWTTAAHVDPNDSILFYKAGTGEAAVGTLQHGEFRTTAAYGNFSPGWTSISYVGLNGNLPLLYNSSTGAATLGWGSQSKPFPKGSFPPGWTHVAWNPNGAVFYDTYHGSGAVVVPVATGSSGSPFAPLDDLKTTFYYKAGNFTTEWTHLAATRSHFLFYNRSDGTVAIGAITGTGFQTLKQYSAGAFSPGWTHIVGVGGERLFFYNETTGSAAIGEIDGNEFHTTKPFPPGSFARNYSIAVCSAD